MEADGVQAEEFLEYGREQMLPGVLLHVVEAPRPIDLARHLAVRRERRRETVRNALLLIHHFDHRHPGDRPSIERLSARSRIKERAVQVHGAPVPGALHYARLKFAPVGIGVIEPFSHRSNVILLSQGRDRQNPVLYSVFSYCLS